MTRTLTRIAGAALAMLALGIGAACSANTAQTPTSATTPSAAVAGQASQPARVQQPPANGEMTVADLVKLVEPAIVKITTSSGVGSGFVIDAGGYVMTNSHVITGVNGRAAPSIQVTMSDGADYRATVVGADAKSDLALLKIDATGLKALKLANLADVVVGQDVVAIGYALDLTGGDGASFTVTRGIVSAKNRSTSETGGSLGAVQTDAAINHGNSGGPLLDLFGDVVGVNTSIAPDQTTGGVAPGIGFAVGSDMVRAVYDELKANGKVNRGLLGIQNFQMLRPAKAKDLGVPVDTGGVYLDSASNIPADGPAGKAGLQAKDVIVAIAGTAVRNEADLAVAMVKHHAGEQVTLEVYRGGKKISLQVALGTPSGQ